MSREEAIIKFHWKDCQTSGAHEPHECTHCTNFLSGWDACAKEKDKEIARLREALNGKEKGGT